jgi:hypothetical protein
MHYWKRIIVALGAALGASSAYAEEWSATMRLTSGGCRDDRLAITVKEEPGLLQTSATVGNQVITRKVALAPDGSGTLNYESSSGLGYLQMVVPAGRGPREIRQSQIKGSCAYVFKPN